MAYIPKNYARLEVGYREKALKLFPWVCGRCSREFVYSNLRELTVHHTWDLRAPAPTPSHLRATVAIKGSFRGAEF